MPPARVTVMTLAPSELVVDEDLPGRVAALRTAEIRPQVSGILQRTLFSQGAEIQAGTALFQINPAPFKAEVETAAAALQRARAVLERARIQAERLAPLVRAEAVSRQVYDDAVSQREQAAADVAQAQAVLARRQLDLRFATVEAPISGRIDQTLVSEGALVTSTDASPMATLQQIDQVYVDVRQSAASLERLREALEARGGPGDGGLPVQILGSSGKPYGLHARILFSGINVDAGTGDVLLRVLVDNPERRLLPGMFVRARVVRAHYPAALAVPQQAVVRAGEAASVWVIDEQQQAKRIAVELGELVDRRYRIAAGLGAGQRVVVEGIERLEEGAAVDPRPWQPSVVAGLAATAH
ncbi:efflux RND transporter periplasmic adaptor subunit [Metapseudomonas otitidis]|uniref:efflux RND transporter periplasmic adaptor subunit n=1 Tax=Metapseudomonas otitidis TaxID=319939 RepID=UPI001FC8F632|nr:efflux RND transporter periplasmic adaptor subunit [Pseudomonas otitidis]